MLLRITRTIELESKLVARANTLDTFQLKSHLQSMTFSVAQIDEEVAALKSDIIKAAHKHHITVDKRDTQPDSPFNTPQNREKLIKLVEKQQNQTTRIS